ncbi:hypothetical protein GCK72_025423 [Caenorhabditis remanei]|uniref:Uncharacterized protein n=1 Tax=Caenorhabditis remanei TaxID=31234 RepID=A0A6A5G1Z0_CAERE|nr:hypothetical protein GCK72_025423 [Caenorhabditis remanei]KAF1748956.1 hypothetical protein GCK72_025423 [Caenorhabditis remanei]
MEEKKAPVQNLLDQLSKINEMPLDFDAVAKLKQSIRTNPLHQSIQSVLVEKKQQLFLSPQMIKEECVENEERLDNMLRAEGITDNHDNVKHEFELGGDDQDEYRRELANVRKKFAESMKLCQENRANFCETVKYVLHSHGEFRPITHSAIEKMAQIVSNKFSKVSELLKQSTCESVIQLRRRYFDARRKRRNFSKSSTQILNDYFAAHISHPYPSEEVKQALALQCNISVAQVSNWFGNKRIRYKKTMSKNEEEHREIVRNTAGRPSANPYNFGFPGMPNPYQMMMPGQPMAVGMAPFNFPVYNPEMVRETIFQF